MGKEYFVMEHDFFVGLGLFAVLGTVVKQVGPSWTEEINKELDEEEAQLRSIRQGEIDRCKAAIEGELGAQQDAAAYADIITAKKEAVGLQLEAANRARLLADHAQVKKRLDYQLETANVLRRNRSTWLTGSFLMLRNQSPQHRRMLLLRSVLQT